MRNDSAQIFSQSFLQEALVVHPAFPLLITASPTLQGALKDGFRQAVLVCDMPKPSKFPYLDSCQKRFLWTHKEVDLAPHPVIGLALQVGDAAKFPQAPWFRKPGSSPHDSKSDQLSKASPL